MNNNNNNSTKRKNDATSTEAVTKRARSRLDMTQGPKIPVRSTLASRSNANSPSNRFSNASTSSNTSTNKRLSNSSTTTVGRLSNASTSKRLSNGQSSSSSTTRDKRLSNSSNTSLSKSTSIPPVKIMTDRNSTVTKKLSLDYESKNSSSSSTKQKRLRIFMNHSDPKKTIIDMQERLESTGEEVSRIEKLQQDQQSTMIQRESGLLEAQKTVRDLELTIQSTQEKHEQEIIKIREKHHMKNRSFVLQNDTLKRQMDGRDQEVKDCKEQVKTSLKAMEDEKRDQIVLKVRSEKSTAAFVEMDKIRTDLQLEWKINGGELEKLEKDLQELDHINKLEKQKRLDMEAELVQLETLRRKDHNRIQELKGNIRVFCRVRPCLEEKDDISLAKISYFGEDNEKMELSEQISSTLGKTSTRLHSFSFDRVFSPESTQKDCFEEISQLVQSALDGYNVCIFAYGQTGSGKTFTMQGPATPTDDTMGMIPRAVHQIYHVAQQLKQFDWHYTMEGQFLEIYNEVIHDLLGDVSSFGKIKHEIHHGTGTTTTVTDMTTMLLDSPNQVTKMLRKASQNRATGATNLNERSSRSHSVFTLKLTGKNLETGETTQGILNLIDLAGSERLSMSGSKGDRLKETQAINKSLSCLGDVIQALVNDEQHVPYRNSKLTYLLKNSLGGNCKTLMFVNVSPMMEHFGETICSLRFATKVNSCQIGTTKKPTK